MKTVQTNLFIGGPYDGERHEIDASLTVVDLPVVQGARVPKCEEAFPWPSRVAADYSVAVYHRERLRDGDSFFVVWRHESLIGDQLLGKLVEGYREP